MQTPLAPFRMDLHLPQPPLPAFGLAMGNASRTTTVARQKEAPAFPLVLVRLLGVGIVAVGVMFVLLIASGRV